MVEVADDKIIRIRNSFASGSDQIKPEFLPMLKKIAKDPKTPKPQNPKTPLNQMNMRD